MLSAKKNTIITLSIFAGCLLLGYVYSLFFNAVEKQTVKPTSGMSVNINKPQKNYFEEYRLVRDRSRSRQVELLRELVNNPNSVQESRKEAQRKLLNLIEIMDNEAQMENVLIAHGYKDAVVFMKQDTVTVVIDGNTFMKEDASKIKEIISQFVDISTENIIILPSPTNP